MATGTSGLSRQWRRFRRRPPGVQVGTAAAIVVVVAVVVAVTVSGSSGHSPSSVSQPAGAADSGYTPVDEASTSSAGVTATSINVVFPVSNLVSLSSNFGFAGDAEFGHQVGAIDTYVNAINDAGGIDGRKINPIIVDFDPTNEVTMRALCKQWTEGNADVFAVIDGVGAWTGDNELCITQEGHTPFIGQWSTVDTYLKEGSPYLWWTGPDQTQVLATLVSWAKGAGELPSGHELGIVVGDRTSDQDALDDDLLPDLRKAGITDPLIEELPAEVSETASTNSEAPLIVQRLESAGATTVIPLVPFNALLPYLSAEQSQDYHPRLLLSDYESSIQVSLGLIPTPYEAELDNQPGVTVLTLGGTDAPIPESKGGYDPGVESCYQTWKAHNPPVAPTVSPYIEEQGPIAGWCQAIRLFAAAATNAGRDLNRRTFAEGMAKIKDFQGTWTPSLSYGPTQFAGPSQYRVVTLHNNVPPSKLCVPTYTGKPQGTCWHILQNWAPLVGG